MNVTERAAIYDSYLQMLQDAGYPLIGRLWIRRPQMLSILTMAVAQIAWLTNRVPIRVYQCLLVRFGKLARGAVASPSRQSADRGQGRQDTDDLHVYCPCCGQDLLAAGPPTMEEIAEGKARAAAMRRRSPRKFPQSSENEGRLSPSVGNAAVGGGVIGGAGGTGGGDPAGAGFPTVPPHSPSH